MVRSGGYGRTGGASGAGFWSRERGPWCGRPTICRDRSEGGALQVEVGEVILGLVGAGGGHRDLDATHADADLGADLEELEPDRATGGGG